jgi:hypothetical protein
LLKLTVLPREEAPVALLGLPEVFADTDHDQSNSTRIEVHLFEFEEIGQRVFHPVILVRG